MFVSVVGTRPNFVKLAPVVRAFARRPEATHLVVHTGQHYDASLSEDVFRDLELPPADYNLGVGSGSHAAQTARVMLALEPVFQLLAPERVIVYGDVNSTLAATLVAAKLGIPTAHVEAGLRSGDRTMPEELNRLVTDRLADLLFAPSSDAVANLLAEGVAPGQVHLVGNVMVDSLRAALPAARRLEAAVARGLTPRSYVLVTLHRPSNVDDPAALAEVGAAIEAVGGELPVLFPVHPRTRERLRALPGWGRQGDVRLVPPVRYLEMLSLVETAAAVLTDSGGLQEETTVLGVPCLTLRPNTERPITCTEGTNRLVTPRRELLVPAVHEAIQGRSDWIPSIAGWDGFAAERIAAILCGEPLPATPADRPAALAAV